MTTDKKTETKDGLRITDQFRGKRGMVYDFRSHGARLTVCISPRANQDDQADWRVEAWAGGAPEAAVITEWGATRAAALSAVALFWAEHHAEQGLPPFDWEEVTKALGAVRAL